MSEAVGRQRSRGQKLLMGVILVPALLAALLLGLQHYAARMLKQQVLGALGPDSSVAAVRIDLRGVVLEDLRIRAPEGWPAGETLRAARLHIVPDLRSLFSGPYRLRAIEVDGAYLSALRPRRGGFQVLPNLLQRPPDTASATQAPSVEIERIQLTNAAIDFFDAGVQQPPLRLRVEELAVLVEGLVVPALDQRSTLTVSGLVRGRQRDGRLHISGWIVPATRESSLHTQLQDVDLTALEPYLLQASEAGVRRGTLSLDLRAEVRDQQLRAPGQLRLAQLELSSGGGLKGRFMGVPRSAVLALLRDNDGRIDLQFTLQGDLANPQFSLNEDLSRRLAYGMAESVGVSLAGVAKGVGTLGQKGVSAVGDAAKGLGRAVGSLFNETAAE